MRELDNKVASVSGAGTGIGRGIAAVPAKHGAAVMCTNLQRAAVAETAGTITDGGQAIALTQDVIDWKSTHAMMRRHRTSPAAR